MVAAGTTPAVQHLHTHLEEDRPAAFYPTRWLEQLSASSLVSGSTGLMRTPTIMITASTIAPTLRSPRVRTRLFLSLVCARCTAPVAVTTAQTQPIWIHLWEMGVPRMRIVH